jgi:hypothetical protein
MPVSIKKDEIVTLFGVAEPDNHYGYATFYEISGDFKFPYDLEYLIEKWTEADCSGAAMNGITDPNEIRDSFMEWANYPIYRGTFIFTGTRKAIKEIEEEIEPDYDQEGSSQYTLEYLKSVFEEIEGLNEVIFLNIEDGKFIPLKGLQATPAGVIGVIVDRIMDSKKSAQIVSKMRSKNPDNPIIKEIQNRTGSDIFTTLADLGDLGF